MPKTKEEQRDYCRDWYQKNKERKKAQSRQYSRDHKEKHKEAVGKWKSENPNYMTNWYHKKGLKQPMAENKECPLYLGVHIAETVLSKVFENVEKMPQNNPGYDFICNKGYKIDVKSACLNNRNYWAFSIYNNKIPDYFLLLAFDNRTSLKPLHLWLIKSTEIPPMVRKRQADRAKSIGDYKHFVITNIPEKLIKLKQYELTDKLEKVIELCNGKLNK